LFSDRRSNDYILLPTPLEAAKAFLEKEGYTITPPKPKLTGKVYLYSHPVSGFSHSLTTEELAGRDPTDGHSGTKLIAVLDWTEGDGLTVPLVGDADSMV
jgi:hypothetical protein